MTSALLVIDMLNDFIKPNGALSVGESGQEIVPFIKDKIETMHKQGGPVIYVCDSHRSDDSEFKMFPPHCLAGTEGARVIDELAPAEGDIVIPKRRYSGFFGTDLDLYLREFDVSKIELTGVCTNICVLYTAADACMRNYEVMVYKKGTASFDLQAHEFALKQMENVLGVEVKI